MNQSAPSPPRVTGLQLRFTCPQCGTVLEVPRSHAGVRGPCPVCKATLIAPMVVRAPLTAGARSEGLLPQQPSVPLAPTPERLREPSDRGPSRRAMMSRPRQLSELPPRLSFRARPIKEVGGPVEEDERPMRRRSRRPKRHGVVSRWAMFLLMVGVALGLAYMRHG